MQTTSAGSKSLRLWTHFLHNRRSPFDLTLPILATALTSVDSRLARHIGRALPSTQQTDHRSEPWRRLGLSSALAPAGDRPPIGLAPKGLGHCRGVGRSGGLSEDIPRIHRRIPPRTRRRYEARPPQIVWTALKDVRIPESRHGETRSAPRTSSKASGEGGHSEPSTLPWTGRRHDGDQPAPPPAVVGSSAPGFFR